jgi:hypothetical protein
MKKIISFSLWGNNPIYTIGAIRNAELSPIIYPNWICRFYIGKSTNIEIVEKLKQFSHVEVVEMEVDGDWTGMFWRFYPTSEEDVDVMISRDCDSRLSEREKLAVDEWLTSDKGFHIMRDHPYHNTAILGGMWGSKKEVLPQMKKLIDEYIKGSFWQVDQNFLREEIYPIIKDNSFIHDEFMKFETWSKLFPSERKNKEFVGDVFDSNNVRHPEYYKYL